MVKNSLFFELLDASGVITAEGAKRLLERFKGDSFAVMMHLVQAHTHHRQRLAKFWGDSLGFAYVDLNRTLFQAGLVQRLPESFARAKHIIPLYEFGEAVTVATSDPQNTQALGEAGRLLGKPVSAVFSLPDDIETAIEIEYKSDARLRDLSNQIVADYINTQDLVELTRDQLERMVGSKAVIELVQGLLLLAIRDGASDIHIQPGEEHVRVRFRVDGLLQEKNKLEKSLLGPMVSRLKILSGLDITEKRKPQDGRITLTFPNRSIDFRFSSVPTIYGEKVVLRVLGQTKALDIPDVSELDLSKSVMHTLKRVMDAPYGLFLVTGPTGSGKTTTLFSMLKYLNKPELNITTIEDPIEYRLEGINQVQVNLAADLDFPTSLRSFLRQDPDIILVGEIRDLETAEIACRAALTGHMVLATLHTNSAVQAVTRLADIGVQPHILAPSLVGVLAQRLVRRICEHCKEKYSVSAKEIGKFLISDGRDVSFSRGTGCEHCSDTGYSGRIAIHEAVFINAEIRALLVEGASPMAIFNCAVKSGFQSMRYDGIKKVLRGLTTMAEIERVTLADDEGSGSAVS